MPRDGRARQHFEHSAEAGLVGCETIHGYSSDHNVAHKWTANDLRKPNQGKIQTGTLARNPTLGTRARHHSAFPQPRLSKGA